MTEGYLNAQEIAENLGVAERTVRRWIKSGRLRAAKEHGTHRIRLDDAVELMRSAPRGRLTQVALETADSHERELLALRELYISAREEAAEWRGRARVLEEQLDAARRELASAREPTAASFSRRYAA